MANYQGFTRSSYFVPKDLKTFKDWLDSWCYEDEFKCWADDADPTQVAFGGYDDLPGSKRGQNEEDDYVDGDFIAELQEHLAEGWGVIVTSVGYEKLRYLCGHAWVVTKAGTEVISLGQKADEMTTATTAKFGRDTY